MELQRALPKKQKGRHQMIPPFSKKTHRVKRALLAMQRQRLSARNSVFLCSQRPFAARLDAFRGLTLADLLASFLICVEKLQRPLDHLLAGSG